MKEFERLLVVNYTMDSTDLLLSHQVEIVKSLAKSFGTVNVITSNGVSSFSESNINVINLNWISHSRIRNLLVYTFYFLKSIIFERPSVVFFHMTDFQAFLSGPLLRIFRIKGVLWYAHKKRSKFLRFAEKFMANIVSSTIGSYPTVKRTVTFIGQSINSENFPFQNKSKFMISNLIHVGRLDPAKRIDYIIDQVEKLRDENFMLELNFVGSQGNNNYSKWVEYLHEKSRNFTWVQFVEGVPRIEVSGLLKSSDVFIHAYLGSLDKTLIEATMTGIPVVTENLEYNRIFGTWSKIQQPNLIEEMLALRSVNEVELANELQRRCEIAYTSHSLDQWIKKLILILKS